MDVSPVGAMTDETCRNTVSIELNDWPLPVRMRLGNMQLRISSGPPAMIRPTAIVTFDLATVATLSVVNLLMSMFRARVR